MRHQKKYQQSPSRHTHLGAQLPHGGRGSQGEVLESFPVHHGGPSEAQAPSEGGVSAVGKVNKVSANFIFSLMGREPDQGQRKNKT